MPDINYIEILKHAWRITWKNRFLWWFGFFVALTGGAGNFNSRLPFDSQDSEKYGLQIKNFIVQHLELVIALSAIIFVLFVLFLILGSIGRGALIKSTNNLIKNQPADFRFGWQEGKKYFGKLILLSLVLFLFVFSAILILAIPVIVLVANKSYGLGIVIGIFAVLILIPLLILTAYLYRYSSLYLVLGDLKLWPAMESAYALFRKNILASIVMSLFFIPVGIFMLFVFLALLFILGIFFGLPALALYHFLGKTSAIIAASLGLFIFLVFTILINSVFQVFSQTTWVIFFRQIAAPKVAQGIAEKETEKVEKPLAAPDPVKTAEIEK